MHINYFIYNDIESLSSKVKWNDVKWNKMKYNEAIWSEGCQEIRITRPVYNQYMANPKLSLSNPPRMNSPLNRDKKEQTYTEHY